MNFEGWVPMAISTPEMWPELPKGGKLNRDFVVCEGNVSIEVTSIDISQNGCYVIVGCNNGDIYLYDMDSSVNASK